MENNKLKFIYVEVEKYNVWAESKEAIRIFLEDKVSNTHFIWFQKKYAFPSDYRDIITLSLVENWEYEIKNEENKLVKTIKGKELYKMITGKELK